MKKYSFSLETLLFHRETKMELSKQKVAAEMQLLSKYQNELAEAFSQYKLAKSKPHPAQSTPAEMQLRTNYINMLLQNIEKHQNQVREQKKALEKVQKVLRQEHSELEVVKKLKEKDYEKYQVELRRWETRQLDDFTVTRHALNKMNNHPQSENQTDSPDHNNANNNNDKIRFE